MTQKQGQEYLITDTMLKFWRKGCINLDEPHTNNEFCKKNCGYRGKGARANCCDFDDNDMEKIFRSNPYNPVESEQLTENQKTTRILNQATHDYRTRRNERETVLKDIETKIRDIGMHSKDEAVILQVIDCVRSKDDSMR